MGRTNKAIVKRECLVLVFCSRLDGCNQTLLLGGGCNSDCMLFPVCLSDLVTSRPRSAIEKPKDSTDMQLV